MAVNPYLAVHALGECQEALHASQVEVANLRGGLLRIGQLVGHEFEYQVRTLKSTRLSQPLFDGFRDLWVKFAMQFHEIERQTAHLYYLPALKMRAKVDFSDFAFNWENERQKSVQSVVAIEGLLDSTRNEFKSIERFMNVFFDKTKVHFEHTVGRNVWAGPEDDVFGLLEKAGNRFTRELSELIDGVNGFHGRLVTLQKIVERGVVKAEAAKDKVSVG